MKNHKRVAMLRQTQTSLFNLLEQIREQREEVLDYWDSVQYYENYFHWNYKKMDGYKRRVADWKRESKKLFVLYRKFSAQNRKRRSFRIAAPRIKQTRIF